MKKILYLLLIVLFYSCCAKKNAVKIENEDYYQPSASTEKGNKGTKKIYKMLPAPEARPEPRPLPTPAPYPEPEPDISGESHRVIRDVVSHNTNNIRNRQTTSRISQPLKPFEFTKGDINFVVKDTMVVGITNEVNMTISKDVDINKIISEVKTFNSGNLRTDSIRIAPTMKARLVDPSNGVNFKIVPKTNEEQFIEAGDYTRWTWSVTPLNKGNNGLSMVVDVMYEDKGKTYQVYDGVIYVYSIESFYDKLITFLVNNWQYLLSTLLLPFIYFIYTAFKKKK